MSLNDSDMAALAQELLDAEVEVKRREAELAGAKEYLRILREVTIPSAMEELNYTKIERGGYVITVAQEVYVSIPADNRNQCFDWLEEHGHGGIIKTKVLAEFGKGELDKAVKLYHELGDRRLQTSFDRNVHPQTLKSFVKKELAKGSDFPLDLFNAQPVMTAKVKKI